VAWGLSSMFARGGLRSLEPAGGPRLDWAVTWLGAAAIVAGAAVTAAVVGLRGAGARAARAGTGRRRGSVPMQVEGVPLIVGAHFAAAGSRDRRPWASLLAGSIGMAGVVAAAIVG